ncbi:TolC family protein [Desulfovibrio ferrophilus]|uniref:Outer membrane efflux protein n=1 Tax=Desulfovibrio ferrophilus TaxID=241368 RepID=A0A2Z6B3B6_9BACT|nr:TolC family protein [Desulfovibrio ferrophilus]BBD09953.1 outer membrane efflux protein [Desulfovibrio ferrophilus]
MKEQSIPMASHPFSVINSTALITLAVLLVLLAALPVRAKAEPLQALLDEGLANNQELASQRQLAEALRAEAPFYGSLQDPRLGIGLSNVPMDSFELDQEAMTQKQLFIAQKVPWFGTLDLAQQAALLKAVRQEARVQAKALELTRMISTAWYDLAFVQRGLETNKRLEALVSQALRIAETRYATGKGLQQDILAAQVQLSELLDERISLERRRRTLSDRINTLLHRESFRTIPLPSDIPQGAPLPSTEAMNRQALQNNPGIALRQADVDSATIAVKLAEKDYYPDMDFRLAYGQREDNPMTGLDRPDFLSGSVTFSVPLWQATRQDSKLDGAQKKLDATKKALVALERSLPHQVDALRAEIFGYSENHALLRTALTVQATQWADSSLAAYEVGKIQFDTMLSARVRLLRYELRADRYQYEQLKKLAELEELLGGPIHPEGIETAVLTEETTQ